MTAARMFSELLWSTCRILACLGLGSSHDRWVPGGFKARLTANTLRWAPCHEDPRSKRSPFEMAEMAARSTPLELVEGQGACNSSTMFHQKVQFGEKRMR